MGSRSGGVGLWPPSKPWWKPLVFDPLPCGFACPQVWHSSFCCLWIFSMDRLCCGTDKSVPTAALLRSATVQTDVPKSLHVVANLLSHLWALWTETTLCLLSSHILRMCTGKADWADRVWLWARKGCSLAVRINGKREKILSGYRPSSVPLEASKREH